VSVFAAPVRGEVPGPAPLISVVIPTDGRRPQLLEAVQSVLADGHSDTPIEVIVVADGVDSSHVAEVSRLDGTRVEVLPMAMGAALCRNRGIDLARGSLVAFLDDDDLWVLGKARVLSGFSAETGLVIAGRVRRQGPVFDDVVPDRPPRKDEHLSDFLFTRGFRGRASFLQTSGLAATQDVARAVRFRPLLSRHQDYDFLLRAVHAHGAHFTFVDEVIGEWRVDEPRGSTFRHPSWRASAAWCHEAADLFTPRARGAFLTCVVGEAAAAAGERRAALRTAYDGVRSGRPSLPELILGLYWPIRGRRRGQG
jgi:hypothetical protein